MTRLQQSSNNNSKSPKILGWIGKFSWLLFLQGNISFQGLGWKVELQYQPFFENQIFTELVQNSNPTDESIQ